MYMEKLAEFAARKYVQILFLIIGVFVPGLLTIAIFNRELFLSIDLLRLILLSAAIGTPSMVTLFGVMFFSLPGILIADETEVALTYACSKNIVAFSTSIAIKIAYRGLSLLQFVLIIITCMAILVFGWFVIERKGVKKALSEKNADGIS